MMIHNEVIKVEDKFLTYAEAIKFLKLSRATIDRLIVKREIPNYKVGKRRLFDRDELIDWVKSHKDGKRKKSAEKVTGK
jgi:excisionase family DNA binding protein